MKLRQINMISKGLGEFFRLPLKGPIKFKIVRNARAADTILEDAIKANNNDPNLPIELLEEEAPVTFEKFTIEELEDIEVTPEVIYTLWDIIETKEEINE